MGYSSLFFSSKILYAMSISFVAINLYFFPDLLNGKDIKLYDMSYLINKDYTLERSSNKDISNLDKSVESENNKEIITEEIDSSYSCKYNLLLIINFILKLYNV